MITAGKFHPIALAAVLFAAPAFAGDVSVGSVTANQYTHPSFQVLVQASSTALLTDVKLTVDRNGTKTVLVPDSIAKNNLDGQGYYVVWTISIYQTGVVQTGDVLIVEVTDADGATDTVSAGCRDGYTKKKKTNIAVSCG